MDYKIFGCKVNKYYTDKWLSSDYLKGKKGVFIASCVVTDQAKRRWIKFVKDIFKKGELKENIGGKLYISGCGAFKAGEAQKDFFNIYPELNIYREFIEILNEDPGSVDKKLSIGIGGNLYTKKFVLIQGGCDSFCTYCLTVIKRGRHFSRTKEDIIFDILEAEKQGIKEVVLTGINLGAWGLKTTNDIGQFKLVYLLNSILENTSIARIRISSLGPEFIDKSYLNIFKNTRIYPHFHLSIQSGSSSILKSMHRNYDGEYLKSLLNKLRNIKREDKVNISLGADIIVGFPGETDSDFYDTYNLIKEYSINKLHIFPFSAHEMGESVPAGKFLNQVDDKIKKERVDLLLNLGDDIRKSFINSQIGTEFKVLIEKYKDSNWSGWSENYIECNQDNFEILSGKIAKNEIVIGKLKI